MLAGWTRARFLLRLSVLLAIACGARSELWTGAPPPSSGAGASNAGSGASTSGAGGSAGSGGGMPTCKALQPSGPVVQVSDSPGDVLFTSAVRDGDDVLVAYTNDNDPSGDPTWRVRRVLVDGSFVAGSQVVLNRGQSVSFGGLSLANGALGRVGVAWDEVDGCRFASLGADGAPNGDAHRVGDGWCYWLHETAGGFSFFDEPFAVAPIALSTLDAGGQFVAMTPPLTPGGDTVFPAGRAWFDDGSFLLAWHQNVQIIARHFSAEGDALASARLVARTPMVGADLALASLGASALEAIWDPQSGQVSAAAVSADGDPATTNVIASSVVSGSVALAPVGAGALLAWSAANASDPTAAFQLSIVNVGADGSPKSSPVLADLPSFVADLAVVLTPAGGLVVFTGELDGPEEVYALPLACTVRD